MNRSCQGFTLLEAMVAIVILTTAMFATYSWVNVSVQMLIRADEVMTQEILLDELVNRLHLIDLERERSGELSLDGLVAEWHAQPLLSREGKNTRGFTGYYDHHLHVVDILVKRNDQKVAEYSTRLGTYHRVREPRLEE
ncbi:MAG: prepilin-type N-terminal cleavage/methylation domain-containing protein [Pseudomonadales bacterium]|nr:prepilin-type N-terminal cleavage/methylation domain-containing protein [Pseudomonadales bacterium]